MEKDNIINYTADNGNVDVIEFDEADSTVKVSVITSLIGPNAVGLPGGKKGQVYTKLSDDDYDIGWQDNLAEGVEGIRGIAESDYSQGFYTITPEKIGLGKVDNTADKDKPISDAQAEVNDKLKNEIRGISTVLTNHKNDIDNPHRVTKSQVGLTNVTNDAQVKRSELGNAGGVAQLDENAKILAAQLPDFILGQLLYGGNVSTTEQPVPEEPIALNDVLETLHFNVEVTPDFTKYDWSKSVNDALTGQHILTIISSESNNVVEVVKYDSGAVVNGVTIQGNAYFISVNDGIVYATPNMSSLLNNRSGWFAEALSLTTPLTVNVLEQQNVWNSYISKSSKWSEPEGNVVAELTIDAQKKLNTALTSIVLTNDTTPITGYVSNYGLFYPATNNFTFAGIDFRTGDWLISTGRRWTKIDNTDAVTGVKGGAEKIYRVGPVNITQENIGLYKYYNVDATFEEEDAEAEYPCSAKVTLPELNSEYQIPDVYFSKEQIATGNYAPYCDTFYQEPKEGQPVNPIAVGDSVTKFYFNTSITPDFLKYDWENNASVDDDGRASIALLKGKKGNTFLPAVAIDKYPKGFEIEDGKKLASDNYLLLNESVAIWISEELASYGEMLIGKKMSPGWQVQNIDYDATLELVNYQDIWGSYISKDGKWQEGQKGGYMLKMYSKEPATISVPVITLQ